MASGIYSNCQNSNDILKLPTAALLTATPQRAAIILPAEIRARRAASAHHHKLVRAVAAPQLVGGPLAPARAAESTRASPPEALTMASHPSRSISRLS